MKPDIYVICKIYSMTFKTLGQLLSERLTEPMSQIVQQRLLCMFIISSQMHFDAKSRNNLSVI